MRPLGVRSRQLREEADDNLHAPASAKTHVDNAMGVMPLGFLHHTNQSMRIGSTIVALATPGTTLALVNQAGVSFTYEGVVSGASGEVGSIIARSGAIPAPMDEISKVSDSVEGKLIANRKSPII